jgi:ankyrin repeat protein
MFTFTKALKNYAATYKIDVIRLLIAHGALLIAEVESKRTMLHEAATSSGLEVIIFFLEKVLLATKTDILKRTALHYAVQGNNLEVVRFLHEDISLSMTARCPKNFTSCDSLEKL